MAINDTDPNIDPSTGLPWGQQPQQGSGITPTGGFKGWVVNPDGSWSIDPSYTATPGQTSPSGVPSTNYAPPPAPPPDPSLTGDTKTGTTPPPATGPGTSGDGLVNAFPDAPPPLPGGASSYLPPTPTYPNAPSLGTPPIYTPTPWKAPSVEDALNDPGYQFRTQQGEQALQGWAAARGTLNDSGTAKALQDYGQGAASSEYQNVWNRDYGAWNSENANNAAAAGFNYNTQYFQPYQASATAFQNDVVNPTQTAYTTAAAAGQYQTNTNYQDAYNQWLQKYSMFRNRQLDTVNVGLATA